jgi:hypothetical protein
VLAALLLMTAPASAKPPPEAARLFGACVARFEEGKLEQARACFQKVLAIYPSPVVLYNLGRIEEGLGHLVEAYETYQRCLSETSGPLTADDRQDVRASLEALNKRLAFLRVRTNALGATVHIDGEPRGAPAEKALPVLPGAHDVRVEAPGHRPWREQVTAALGTVHEVVAVLVKLTPAPASSPASAPAPSPQAAQPVRGLVSPPVPVSPVRAAHPSAEAPEQTPTVRRRAETKGWRPGVFVRGDLEPVRGGGAVAVGACMGLGRDLEFGVAALIGPTMGLYGGLTAFLLRGTWRPLLALGMPVFFSDGQWPGVQAGAGVEWNPLRNLGFMLQLGVVHYPTAPPAHDHTMFLPSLGVTARL